MTTLEQSIEIAIIGAGTAGLTAYKEAIKYTNNVILIDHGPLGTTCARIGCMPSKVFIQAANAFHDRLKLEERGVQHVSHLKLDASILMKRVRKLRDHFTSGVVSYIESLGTNFICGKASFIDKNILRINDRIIHAKHVIIATGTHTHIPDEWKSFDNILTVDNFFEQTNCPDHIVTIGGGAIGLELTQALSRIGVEVALFHSHDYLGPLTDPEVNSVAIKILSEEFPIHLHEKASINKKKTSLIVSNKHQSVTTNAVLLTAGMKSNLASLNLEQSGAKLDDDGFPRFNKSTLAIDDTNHFLAGDANKSRPILHEAADDGLIAGYNATHTDQHCFERRTALTILFTDPTIAVIGCPYKQLDHSNAIIGEINFRDQGRSKIMSENKGLLRIYADKRSCQLLGAEMICPSGEHIAHLIAWAIQLNLTAYEALKLPFYHPTVEEGLRTALKDLTKQHTGSSAQVISLSMCDSDAVSSLG